MCEATIKHYRSKKKFTLIHGVDHGSHNLRKFPQIYAVSVGGGISHNEDALFSKVYCCLILNYPTPIEIWIWKLVGRPLMSTIHNMKMPFIVWICRIRFVFARIHGFACSFLCYGKVKYDYRKSKCILLPIKVHTINIETKNTYWKLSTTLTCLFGYSTPGRDKVCKLYEPNKIFKDRT